MCSNPACEARYKGIKGEDNRWRCPVNQCQACGNIEFERFDSQTESDWWAKIRLQEKAGLITDLKRQVPFPLFACGPDGERIKVSTYVSDGCWFDIEKQEFVIGDAKPKKGVDDLADLKMKIMAANGRPVTVYST